MSSRNQRLDASSRAKAASLYATLKQSRSADEARKALSTQGFEVDYVEDIANRRLAAASLGNTRLIDNVEI
jgi:pantothenate synthetase